MRQKRVKGKGNQHAATIRHRNFPQKLQAAKAKILAKVHQVGWNL